MSLKTLVMMRWVSLAGSSRLFHFFSILLPLSQSLRMRRVAWNGGIAQHELRKFCASFARSARHKRVDLWAGNRVPLRLKKRDFVRLFTIRSTYILFFHFLSSSSPSRNPSRRPTKDSTLISLSRIEKMPWNALARRGIFFSQNSLTRSRWERAFKWDK